MPLLLRCQPLMLRYAAHIWYCIATLFFSLFFRYCFQRHRLIRWLSGRCRLSPLFFFLADSWLPASIAITPCHWYFSMLPFTLRWLLILPLLRWYITLHCFYAAAAAIHWLRHVDCNRYAATFFAGLAGCAAELFAEFSGFHFHWILFSSASSLK